MLISCQLLLGLEDRHEGANIAESGAPDVAPKADASESCSTLGAPTRPDVDDGVEGEWVFALSRVDFGLDGGLPFQLNLDRTCTCPEADSCKRPADSGQACDDTAGYDNATRTAVRGLSTLGLFSEASLNESLQAGVSGALIRLQGYGGAADDAHVRVSFYSAVGFEGTRPTGRPEDHWTVDRQSLNAETGYEARYEDPNAFVRDRVLVASFDFPLEVGGNKVQAPLRLDLKSGLIVARIDTTQGLLQGVIAGRWPTSSILNTVETLPDPSSGKAICRGTDTYKLLANIACASADIVSSQVFDGEGSACDALSTAIGFDATRASLGMISTRAVTTTPCDGGAVAPTCATTQ